MNNKKDATNISLSELLACPIIDEIMEQAFNAGEAWGNTYQGWFIPTRQQTAEKKIEAKNKIKKWLIKKSS